MKLAFLTEWRSGQIPDRHLLILLLVATLAFFFGLSGAPLFDLDEGAFSEATRQMFVRGDFISPYVNNEPRFDKPILIYWLQAASVWLFGVNETGFRFPSALAAVLWVTLVYRFVAGTMGRTTALVAGIITATSLGVLAIGRAATADALLNLLIAATMLDIYRYYQQRRKAILYRAFLWMGLGILTKGPVAILIPLAVSLMFFASRREFGAWLRAVFNPAGILILIAVALPWYVIQYGREGDAFIQGFFFTHNVGRFSSPMENHGGGLFYYAVVIPLLVLPYTGLLLATLGRVREALRDDLLLYLWLWFLFVFAFFSFSGTKLPHYALYGLTPLFILMAHYRDRAHNRFLLLLPALLFFALLFHAADIILMLQPKVEDSYVAALLSAPGEAFGLSYRLLLGGAVALVLMLLLENRIAPWFKLLLAGLASMVVFVAALSPAAGILQQQPIREAALIAREVKEPLIMWRLNTPSFNVYSGRSTEKREPGPGEVVLTKTRYVAELPAHELLYERRGVALARVLPAGSGK
jgi:4-amino-4-deoxy-L-arabinose transferase-like glycosyltransferase